MASPFRRSFRQWLTDSAVGLPRTLGFGAVTVAGTLLISGVAAEIAAKCRCRYTPVIYAERWGMRGERFQVDVPRADRRQFAASVEAAGALVEPDWKYGNIDGPPLVYVTRASRAAVRERVAQWRRPDP